eukprot:TRINITY_DN8666_c0_g1_i1.p1 TRINITY_DN8666_c0_g1~~TRINITY_DN8666_c0_g1_i1.p1  ORF type:complete len:292 (+),score=81.53 TRINITY_DN8666_c0_g1_i1:139-1014(+)
MSGGFDLDKNLGNRIELKEKLGQGAFSTVYRGVQSGTTEVAVKKLNANVDKRQFVRESNILKTLHHPHVIQYLGLFEDSDKQLCMVVEYMRDGDLLNLIQRETIVAEEKYKMLFDLASAMIYLQEKGIIHADLSARNVLLSGRTVKLTDFGMARESSLIQSSFVGDKNPVRWSAPEVLNSQKYSFESDVWSFGVLIWEVMNDGKVPYGSKDNNQVHQFVSDGGTLSVSDLDVSIGSSVKKCWELKPKDRTSFQSISSVLSSLLVSTSGAPLPSVIASKHNYSPTYLNNSSV